MNSARLERSPRLRRVAAVLEDGRWHSTRDIMLSADVCAVSACVAELRDNGFDIECRRAARKWEYRWTPLRLAG